jgi:hypothetical protein
MGIRKSNPCPHCGSHCRIRTSKVISLETREKYYQCSNIDCSYEYRSVETIISTIRESFTPNPEVNIPPFERQRVPMPTG